MFSLFGPCHSISFGLHLELSNSHVMYFFHYLCSCSSSCGGTKIRVYYVRMVCQVFLTVMKSMIFKCLKGYIQAAISLILSGNLEPINRVSSLCSKIKVSINMCSKIKVSTTTVIGEWWKKGNYEISNTLKWCSVLGKKKEEHYKNSTKPDIHCHDNKSCCRKNDTTVLRALPVVKLI